QVESLLIELLGSRDQWLSYLLEIRQSEEQARQSLRDALAELIAESVAAAASLLAPYEDELLDLALYAGGNLHSEGQDTALCQALDSFPAAAMSSLDWWQELASLLLVKNMRHPAFRKKVDKSSGFPAGHKGKQQKERMEALLQVLIGEQDLLQALNYLLRLPNSAYMEDQWRIIQSLTHVLPHLIAQLNLSFGRHGKIDYTQQSIAALDALGHEQRPSDLGLALDYQIQHILVDEFQDTSTRQNLLLARLTAGWEAGDGRTLFIVGDGMQSCYAFRHANVGLFIAARKHGLGNMQPKSLDLGTNFRANASLVAWVNAIFQQAFPQESNISRGAVTYTAATAFSEATPEGAVRAKIITYPEGQKEPAQQ
ncbi:MAG: UvrD-helicase domain-containing protein, partial [Gammaproteobacteria bacterium]